MPLFPVFIFTFFILFFCIPPAEAQAQTELKVKIDPIEAVQDGAMWRYKEKNSPTATWSLWWDSGEVLEIYSSVFLVEFKKTNSDRWVTPEIRTVAVQENERKVIYETYQSINAEASVRVILEPEAIRGDAKWSLYFLPNPNLPDIRVYIGKNLDSGESLSFKPSMPLHYIEYSFDKDLARPFDTPVPVFPGDTIEITGEYRDLIVGNIHIHGNELEYGGNEFRAYGTTRWSFLYWGNDSGVLFVKSAGDLQGTFSPPVIRGSGSLHANEDLGMLDKMFSIFNDKKFYKGRFLLDAKTLKAIETSHQAPIWEGWFMYAFTVTDFQLIKDPTFGLIQTAEGFFDLPIFSGPSVFRFDELKTYQMDDAPQITGKVIWEGNEVPGLFKISETEVEIDTSTKTFAAEGFDVEIHQILPSFRGEIEVRDGVVRKLGAELYSIDQQAGEWPIYFDNCGFSFKNPAKKSAKVNISAGVRFEVPGTSIDAGSEKWEGELDIDGHLKVSGKREIFGYDIGDAETEVQWKGNQQYVSSFLDASFYPSGYVQFLIEGQGYVYLQWKPSFSFNGWIMAAGWVPLPDWLAGILPGWLLEQVEDDKINLGSFKVSIDALGMRITVSLLKIFTFTINIPPFWNGNSSGPDRFQMEQPDTGLSFASQTMSVGNAGNFTVTPGEAGFILSLQGSGGAPDAVLVQPDGTRIDPRSFVSNDRIHVSVDNVRSVTGFIVNDPPPGLWGVELLNPSGVTQRLIRGNHPPRFLPVKMEREAGGRYSLAYEAFDPDDEAVITFYHSPDCSSFMGKKIGTAVDMDGPGIFSWTPDSDFTASGFISAVIDDGVNPPERAYFEGRTISPNAPAPPSFTGARMSGDHLVLTFNELNFPGIDSLKVYYSDDLETENLTEYFTVFPGSPIELTDQPIPPGRVYQLRVTAFSETSGESGFSERFDIDYRLASGNNHPNIVSLPVLKTRIFQKNGIHDIHPDQNMRIYSYRLRVEDYDGDPLYYSIIRGPEQLNISASGLIHGEFAPNESGIRSVIVQVDDGRGGFDIQKFRIDLTPQNPYDVLSVSRSSDNTKLIIMLNDASGNLKPGEIDRIPAVLQDPVSGGQWDVELRETSAGSGRFQGLIPLNQHERDILRSVKRNYIIRYQADGA